MKTIGIRQAKAHLSVLVRDAAKGECCLVTDNREPVAMIEPPSHDLIEAKVSSSTAIEDTEPRSDTRRVSQGALRRSFSNRVSFLRYGRTTMSTWLLDTPLFKMLASSKAKPLLNWCEANDASLYISAASLTQVALGISKLPMSQSQRASAQHNWLNEIITRFPDRVHPADAAIAMRAGALLPSLTSSLPLHRSHDALLIATAQRHGHGLITCRDGIFGSWAKVPIAIV